MVFSEEPEVIVIHAGRLAPGFAQPSPNETKTNPKETGIGLITDPGCHLPRTWSKSQGHVPIPVSARCGWFCAT